MTGVLALSHPYTQLPGFFMHSASSPASQLGAMDRPLGSGFTLEGNPLLQVLQLAQLAASLPAQPEAPAEAAQCFSAPTRSAAPPPQLVLPNHLPLASSGAPPPNTTTSGTSSELLPRPQGDVATELEPAPNNIAGLKLPVTCNEIRGVVYLDQQVVACYCPTCEHRVAGGHGRPLFSFTRFERHSGSKAKKWRLSIRIEPGAVKEAPPDEPPVALGQWLESKGLVSWAPRGGLKIGPSTMGVGGGSSDDEGSPIYGEDSGSVRRHFPSVADRRHATIGPRPVGFAAPGPPLPNGYSPFPGQKRSRQDYETPDLPSHADRQQWLESQRKAFEAVAAAAAAVGEGSDEGASDNSSQRRGNCAAGTAPPTASSTIAKHAAIFSLVYGLLDEGDDRRAFNEVYLPFLNDLAPRRLESEFVTLLSYLRLLRDGMGWKSVTGQMAAYVRAVVAKAAQ